MSRSQLAASVAIFVDAQCLIIQRARPPYEGLWTLPGGRQEGDEAPEAIAVREVDEELGLRLPSLTPVLVQHLPGFELHVFATRLAAMPQVTPSDEIADMRWAGANALAGIPVTPGLDTVLVQALEKLAQT